MAEAVATRRRETVLLRDGSSVTLEEWSWAKLQEMLPLFLGGGKNYPLVCEQSVRPEDRGRIKDCSAFDIAKLAAAIWKLNDVAELLKNLDALNLPGSPGQVGGKPTTG